MRHQVLYLICIIFGSALFLLCGNGPDLVFPASGSASVISGRVWPTDTSTRVYLMGANGIDSTDVDTTTEMFEFREVQYGFYYLQVKSAGYGTYEKPVYADEPLTSVGTIGLSVLPQLIDRISPPNGTTIDSLFIANKAYLVTDTSIILDLYFEEPMDTAAVRSALVIQPDMPGIRYRWSSALSNCEIHLPRSELDGSSPVQLTIDTTATDRYGHHLEFDFSVSYPVDTGLGIPLPPPLLIDSYTPENNDRSIATNTSIVLWFDSLMHEVSVEKAFTIDPPVPPTFSWKYSNPRHKVEISFGSGLNCSTWYTVTLKAGWMTVDSSLSGSTLTFKFQTEAAAVKSTNPYNGRTNVSTSQTISLTTNFKTDNSSVLNALTISPPVGSINCEVGTNSIDLFHSSFEKGTEYTVTLDSSLLLSDSTTLGRIVTFSFTTSGTSEPLQPADTVYWSSDPENEESDIPVTNDITLYFNTKMDSVAVESLLVIAPAISYYTVWSTSSGIWQHRLGIRPMHNFRSHTTYTVSIDSGYLALDSTPNAAIGFSFTTVPLKLLKHSPPHGLINANTATPVVFTFNLPVDTSSLRKAISSVPPMSDVMVDSIAEGSESASTSSLTYYCSHAPLLADTTYTVTIDTTVTDQFGMACSNGASFEFSTAE
ncbi:MAG: Ig-like domain-containing protein [Chitinispirillaceae bacterium]|nr:Ig-like domain-containing protein [Chitinispirillaceae bacterium]